MAATAMNIFFFAPDASESSWFRAAKDGALEVIEELNVGPECDGLDGSATTLVLFSECAGTSFAGAVAAADPEVAVVSRRHLHGEDLGRMRCRFHHDTTP